MEYSTLREANAARQIEWDAGNQISLSYRANELSGEVGEACNVVKKLVREELGIKGSRDTVEHLAEEIADVVICVDLIAMDAKVLTDPSVHQRHMYGDALLCANRISHASGKVCGFVNAYGKDYAHGVLPHLNDTLYGAYCLAAAYGIDLDAAVANKFNATSEKVGLATRLVVNKETN